MSTFASYPDNSDGSCVFLFALGNESSGRKGSFSKIVDTLLRQEVLVFLHKLCDVRLMSRWPTREPRETLRPFLAIRRLWGILLEELAKVQIRSANTNLGWR